MKNNTIYKKVVEKNCPICPIYTKSAITDMIKEVIYSNRDLIKLIDRSILFNQTIVLPFNLFNDELQSALGRNPRKENKECFLNAVTQVFQDKFGTRLTKIAFYSKRIRVVCK